MRTLAFLPIAAVAALFSLGGAGCDDDSGFGTGVDLGAGDDLAEAPDLAESPDMKPPPGLKLLDVPVGADITPDGRYSLMQDFDTGNGAIYVYDSYTDTLTNRGSSENPDPGNGMPSPSQGAFGISADGSRIAGAHGTPLEMAYFASDGWHELGDGATTLCVDLSGGYGSGWDISDDGKTMVGMLWNDCTSTKAVRWTEAGGFAPLAAVGMGHSRASKVSADGTVAGGWFDTMAADRSPAVWKADGTVVTLDPTGLVVGEVLGLSQDGVTAAGIWNDADGFHGFYWTDAGGVKLLPTIDGLQPALDPSFDRVFPNAVAAGGQLIFGGIGDPNYPNDVAGSQMRAFVWTAKDNKMRILQDIVTAQGFTLPANTTLASVVGASADGSILLGTTLETDPNTGFATQKMFVLRLPASTY